MENVYVKVSPLAAPELHEYVFYDSTKKLNCQTHTHIHTYILHTILLKNPPASDHPQDEACLLSNRVGGSLNIASMQEMWLCALSI